jgi:type I restriction enzyme S subunit
MSTPENRTDWKATTLEALLREVDMRVADLPRDERQNIEVLSLTKRFGLIPQSERFEKRVATENIDKYKVVKQGWIVYNPYVIWEGAVHALRRKAHGAVSPVYAVWEQKEDDGGYLDLILRTPEFISVYEKLSSGAVNRRRSIKKDAFLGIEVTVPPLDERRNIATVLGLVQRIIEQNDDLVRVATELKAALMRKLFTEGMRKEPQKQTTIGLLPESWTVGRLGELCTLSTGTTPSTSRKDYYTGDVPFVKTGEIANNRIRNVETLISKQALQDYGLKLHPRGTVLMAMYGQGKTRGQVGLLEIEAAITQNAAAIRPSGDIDSEFLWQWLMSRYEDLRKTGALGQLSHLNLGYLRKFEIPKPPLSVQRDIAIALRVVDSRITLAAEKSRLFDDLLRTLTHQLMTAQVRIRDVDLHELGTRIAA